MTEKETENGTEVIPLDIIHIIPEVNLNHNNAPPLLKEEPGIMNVPTPRGIIETVETVIIMILIDDMIPRVLDGLQTHVLRTGGTHRGLLALDEFKTPLHIDVHLPHADHGQIPNMAPHLEEASQTDVFQALDPFLVALEMTEVRQSVMDHGPLEQ